MHKCSILMAHCALWWDCSTPTGLDWNVDLKVATMSWVSAYSNDSSPRIIRKTSKITLSVVPQEASFSGTKKATRARKVHLSVDPESQGPQTARLPTFMPIGAKLTRFGQFSSKFNCKSGEKSKTCDHDWETDISPKTTGNFFITILLVCDTACNFSHRQTPAQKNWR